MATALISYSLQKTEVLFSLLPEDAKPHISLKSVLDTYYRLFFSIKAGFVFHFISSNSCDKD